MPESEEARLLAEGEAYELCSTTEGPVSPLESKSFQKKLIRIQKQKERKQREKQQKRDHPQEGEKTTLPLSEEIKCIGEVKRVNEMVPQPSTEPKQEEENKKREVEEQTRRIMERYQQSRKCQQQAAKSQKELALLTRDLDSTVPDPLRHLLLAGVRSGSARIPGYPREQFDRILLDPPCSALGLRPRLSHTVTMEDLYGYRNYQRQFISVAISLLREGGYLVYSTCTFDPLENEENVKFILDSFPMELVPIPQELRFGKRGLAGCGLTEEQCL